MVSQAGASLSPPLSHSCSRPTDADGVRASPLFHLCDLQDGFVKRFRNRDREKETFRIEVVFPGFINGTDLTMFERRGIRKRKVYLSFLKRDRIAFVVHADQQPCERAFDFFYGVVLIEAV